VTFAARCGVDVLAPSALKGGTISSKERTMHRSVWRYAVAVTVLVGAPAGAVTEDSFHLRTGADLVALCSAPSDDKLHAAAVHLCHGYGAGAYQAIMALTSHEKIPPVVCPPNPRPSRNEAVARFLAWANANPQHQSEPAIEFLGRFLTTEYPCPKTTGRTGRAS
jgi:hypothetical protein